MSTYFPPYNLGISRKLQFSQQGICMSVVYTGTRTETENTKFPTIFLRNGTSRKKGLSGGDLGGVWRATPSQTVNTSNGGKPPKRYQNGGTFRVHCFACNLDDKRPLLRGMTGDDHTLTYFSFFILFPFSISIWISFVSSCLFLVGNMLSPRFRFLLRLV